MREVMRMCTSPRMRAYLHYGSDLGVGRALSECVNGDAYDTVLPSQPHILTQLI